MAGRITTHELADLLVKLHDALREGPDLPVADVLKGIGLAPPRRPRRATVAAEPLPPLDPTGLSRDELAAALQDKNRFRTKSMLVDFARQQGVAVSTRDRTAKIITQILRVLYDSPQERTTLRTVDIT
jgi:hypothetical protein